MLTLEGFMTVRDLKNNGWSVSAIAEQLDLDRKTVRKVRRCCLPRMARGQSGSLFLLCTTLSFAPSCRFIPTLSRPGGLSYKDAAHGR
jgi:hypothetical protein